MVRSNTNEIKIILATDCGSTTTKARLFKKVGNEYRFVCTGEAPTTVEAPYEDVTMGVRNAVREIEELMGWKLLAKEGILIRSSGTEGGVDLYVTTSSAGGGLQMSVFGATESITGESANRAALGGGAIVMDVQATSDGVPLYKKIERTRHLRPDIVLVSGGTDGGSTASAIQTSEILKLAEPKARFGDAFSLPVIYAGNKEAREAVKKILKGKFSLKITDNLRPQVELENTDPARDAIQEQFMEHVMSHAPGYVTLMKWTDVDIMPTPMGEGTMFQLTAKAYGLNVIGVGLGGATTNVYSIYDKKFVRTVSANLGMSYSISNVLRETGIDNIIRWIPFDVEKGELEDTLTNKMIRPTTIPQTLNDLIIEHAVAREALRLGFEHHKFLARGLRGVRPARTGILEREIAGAKSYIDLLNVGLIGGTGGLLSHAPRRVQSAIMLIDGFQPEGVTHLIQDSVFMIPHLGVLSTVHPEAAMEIFEKDCLVHLGTCIAPRGPIFEGDRKVEVGELMKVELTMPDGSTLTENMNLGEIKLIPLEVGKQADVTVTPMKLCDMGAGLGHSVQRKVDGGVSGIILDARGRPVTLPQDATERKKTLIEWYKALDCYPKDTLKQFEEEVN